jgi:hypothetical protein
MFMHCPGADETRGRVEKRRKKFSKGVDKSSGLCYNSLRKRERSANMNTITLKEIERTYKNNGQHAEQVARFTLTGKIEKADNLPHEFGGDIGNLQVKSARATVCRGLDITKYLDNDGATAWGYVSEDFKTMYIMNRKEWEKFIKMFGTITFESKKNGGFQKIRLKSESQEMKRWLTER